MGQGRPSRSVTRALAVCVASALVLAACAGHGGREGPRPAVPSAASTTDAAPLPPPGVKASAGYRVCRTRRCVGGDPRRRQYFDERRSRYYFFDPARKGYYWEDGSPRL